MVIDEYGNQAGVANTSTYAYRARGVSRTRAMAGAARLGLTARAVVYLLIGWLAVQIALGHHSQEANQRGAIAEIAQQKFGMALLWLLGVGLAAYALWRLHGAAFGTAAEGRRAGARLRSLVRGSVYAAFAVMTFSFIAGTSRQSQSRQQETVTARVMRHDGGRWLVGLVGLVVVAVGLALIVEGVRKKFTKQLRMNELTGRKRKVVVRAGLIGNVARGIVFALAGVLVIDAAVTYDPGKSTGLDGSLRTLADRSYGPWVLGILAAGLIVFGLYGLAEARWAKT